MLARLAVTTILVIGSILTWSDPYSSKSSPSDLVAVEVAALLAPEQTRSVVLVLKPRDADSSNAPEMKKVLALAIGLEEARSIGVAFHKVLTPRPLSHDLMLKIIEGYGGSVSSCVVTKMERDIFFAELHLKRSGHEFTLDSRPSDAIALAMRAGAPIFVRRALLAEQGVEPNRREGLEKSPKA
jgi:bifunctional DNase/RNase